MITSNGNVGLTRDYSGFLKYVGETIKNQLATEIEIVMKKFSVVQT